MDELDANLLEAWGRGVERLRGTPGSPGDRAEARARWRRSRGKTMRRPMRAWCLTLRASDTRITDWNAWIDDPAAVGYRAVHTVELDGRAVRELCAPVQIPWPGVKLVEAAKLLGRHPEALRVWLPAWARPGRSRAVRAHKAPARYEEICEPGSVLSVRYEKAKSHGHNGMDVPVVWSPRPLNPGAARGASPHALWGTMWQHLQGCIPEEYVLRVDRVPRIRPYGGREARFRGWEWVCPGRFDLATGEPRACGRRVQTLYAPLPVYTIAHWLGDEAGIDVGEGEESKSDKSRAAEGGGGLRLRGRWHPGVEDALAGRRGFACSHCWDLRNFSICDYRGWNEFVGHISGGLLYGKEVKRPGWLRYERKQVQRRKRKVDVPGAARMEVKPAKL